MNHRYIASLCAWICLGVASLRGQLAIPDSMVLLNILNQNCVNCPLNNPGQPNYYWNPNEPAASWFGVDASAGRVNALDLDSIGLTGVFSSFDDCSALTSLNIRGNELTGFSTLSHNSLERMNISSNQIDSLPQGIYFRNLNFLDCRHNNLEHLPDTSQLPGLDTLYCDSNGIYVADLERFHDLDSLSFWQSYFDLLDYPNSECFPYLIEDEDSCLWPLEGPLSQLYSGVSTVVCYPSVFAGCDNSILGCIPRGAAPEIPLFIDSLIPTYFPGGSFYLPTFVTIDTPQGTASFGAKSPIVTNSLLDLEISPCFYFRSAPNYVLCGDSNQDSIRNMFDLYAISQLWGVTGNGRNTTSGPGETQFHTALNWNQEAEIGNQQVNGCHADSNGDGVVNQQDLDCIRANYTPLNQINYLNTTVQDTVALRAVPQDPDILLYPDGRVKVPFRIQLASLPTSLDSVFLRGAIFIRGIAESEVFQTDSIYGDFTFSDFASGMSQIVGMQVYQDTSVLDTGSWNCLNIESKQLDVGVFRNDTSEWMAEGEALLDCHVLIHPEDNIRTGLPDSIIPVIGDVNSVVLYLEDANGDLYEVTAACKSDTTILLMDSLYDQTCIVGEVRHPNRTPIMNATLIGTSSSNAFQTQTNFMGEYSLIVPYLADLEATPHKLKDSMSLAHIDADDLGELADYVLHGGRLSPHQLIAADLNGDDKVDIGDYIELRDYLNGTLPSFSNGLDWVFINEDEPVSTQPRIRYTDSRQYTSAFRNYGQDYTGILLGDINMSWGTTNKVSEEVAEIEPDLIFGRPYPNPTQNGISLDYISQVNTEVEITIFDLNGSVIYANTLPVQKGSGKFKWDATSNQSNVPISASVYYYQIQGPGGTQTGKFIVLP